MILSEIEMTNMRAAMHASPDTETSGDSSTPADRLLTSNHVVNGNGSVYAHHKPPAPSPYALGAPRPRPVTGSGVVFRRRRKPCWCVLLVVVAVALMAAGISLGILFGVVRLGQPDGSEVAVGGATGGGDREGAGLNATDTSSSSSSSSDSDGSSNSGGDIDQGGGVGSMPRPPYPDPAGSTQKPSVISSSSGGRPNPGWGVSVRRFKAYWHPGDSRVMEVLLSNGTVLQAAGHKGNDGTFRGLYSLSLTDSHSRTTRVRFMGGRNLASIILPQGTVVSLDWSANTADVECKVFQIPPPRGAAPNAGPQGESQATPTSHLATLQLGVHSYLLRQISRTLAEASASPGGWGEEEAGSTPTPPPCFPRLPVKVTKCGGQYPYDGAFVQGEVTLETGRTLTMAALPWLRQDDDDACYQEFRGASPNFFIPIPDHVDRATAGRLAARFWKTASRWWGRVCEVVGTVLQVDVERRQVCANMAASAQTQLSHADVYRTVYDSCTALLSSLHLACRTLDDLTTRAAAATSSRSTSSSGNNVGGGGGGGVANGNSASGGGSRSGSRQPLTQELLQRVLANATSLQEPVTSPRHTVRVKTYAFCPSTQPLASFEKALTLEGSGRDITPADMVHVNCPGHPEVTYFYLGHAAAVEPLDMVKHRLKVCAVCAYEKTFSVHVQRDHMCCNDTCLRQSRCEDSISEARVGLGLTESHTFHAQNSVYCHEFLTAADTPTRALAQECMGTCQSNLEVRFQVKDSPSNQDPAMEGGRVYLDQVLTCLEGYRSTCKSTFGH